MDLDILIDLCPVCVIEFLGKDLEVRVQALARVMYVVFSARLDVLYSHITAQSPIGKENHHNHEGGLDTLS